MFPNKVLEKVRERSGVDGVSASEKNGADRNGSGSDTMGAMGESRGFGGT